MSIHSLIYQEDKDLKRNLMTKTNIGIFLKVKNLIQVLVFRNNYESDSGKNFDDGNITYSTLSFYYRLNIINL